MPEKVVASTSLASIIYYDEWQTLELKWLPSTKDASEAEVRESMVLFAEEGENRKPTFMIVDTTEFRHSWEEGMLEWRNAEIVPRYNTAGVTKFAFIAGDGFPGRTVEKGATPEPEGPANFPTGWFASRERAYAWLGG